MSVIKIEVHTKGTEPEYLIVVQVDEVNSVSPKMTLHLQTFVVLTSL